MSFQMAVHAEDCRDVELVRLTRETEEAAKAMASAQGRHDRDALRQYTFAMRQLLRYLELNSPVQPNR